jgi:hypothetical protein
MRRVWVLNSATGTCGSNGKNRFRSFTVGVVLNVDIDLIFSSKRE